MSADPAEPSESCVCHECVNSHGGSKRKFCEMRELPSVMWKRSIVQAIECARVAVAAAPILLLLTWSASGVRCADLVIEIPSSGDVDDGHYRLDYWPRDGYPAPNYTARATTINFTGLPGTKYHFMLYYSNATFPDLLTWNQTIITAPEPPTNLTVTLGRNKQATISWSPPALGEYTGFRFKVIPLTERAEGGARNITVEGTANWTYALRDLSPGATYQLHAFTLLHDKESAAYASRNFTTKPNTPGKFIVWFRNETTLLVLWQPPYPPGAYTHYKVSIVPPDARDSELYVEKEGEPPGPAQAAFKGLVPGRAYSISVQTVSEPEISAPTTAQYRTVPLRPRNVSAPADDLRETAFRVTWLPPLEQSEFEKYQVSVTSAGGGGGGGGGAGGGARRLAPVVRARDDPPACWFDGLEPGAHYTVTVKTMSGKVTSWPATTDLTLKPLPVRELKWQHAAGSDSGVTVSWTPAETSTQDEYKVSYHEAGPSRDDSNTLMTPHTNVTLDALLPGRNYTISVCAVSHGVESNESATWAATRPLAPVVVPADAPAPAAGPGARRELRLAWHSDVTSRQDAYELSYRRRGEPAYKTLETQNTNATLKDLFPGAVYEIRVAAISHGLLSERHTLFKPVRPLPAVSLAVERASSNGALARWRGPAPRDSAVGRFLLRYRTAGGARWAELQPLPSHADRAEIANMTYGERYVIELDTGSEEAAGESVESGDPLRTEHTVRPKPVSNVAPLVDTRNMTLEWPRPVGRVEWYSLRWAPAEPGDPAGAAEPRERNLTAPPAGRTVRALLDGLEPGRGYSISIAAHSYNLTSDLFTMDMRTRPLIQSELTIVNEAEDGQDDELPSIIVVYTRTPASASAFDEYRFRLEGAGEPPRTASRAPDDAQRVRFGALTPGRLYNLTMWTVSRNVTSHPVQRQARLFPRPITRLNATAVGARAVTLAWDRPAGDYTEFEVQYLAAPDQLQTHTTDQLTITLTDLKPNRPYTFSVVSRGPSRG